MTAAKPVNAVTFVIEDESYGYRSPRNEEKRKWPHDMMGSFVAPPQPSSFKKESGLAINFEESSQVSQTSGFETASADAMNMTM